MHFNRLTQKIVQKANCSEKESIKCLVTIILQVYNGNKQISVNLKMLIKLDDRRMEAKAWSISNPEQLSPWSLYSPNKK